ncbi:hypothetical protein QZM91_00365 [Burkholderia multivorans]|nr:hypothetical protein [Burkholderia multivorans]
MNCNCISEIENKLAKRYSEELGADATADCQSAGFAIGDSSVRVIHKTEFEIVAQAKGFARGKLVPVLASYCPFCGKPAAKESIMPGELTDEQSAILIASAYRLDEVSSWYLAEELRSVLRALLAPTQQPSGEATDDDKVCAERYRWLRARMAFVEGLNAPASMSMRSSIPAPNHDFNADFVGDRFDASVDAATDAAIAAGRVQGGES